MVEELWNGMWGVEEAQQSSWGMPGSVFWGGKSHLFWLSGEPPQRFTSQNDLFFSKGHILEVGKKEEGRKEGRKGGREAGRKENTPPGELKPLGMHAGFFKKQRTQKDKNQIKSREGKKMRVLEKERGLRFSVREPGQSLVRCQVPFRLDKVNKTV